MRYGLWVVGFLIIVLLLRFYTFYASKPLFKAGEKIVLTSTLLREPTISGSTQRFYVEEILIITPRFPKYSYGDKLKISGSLEKRVLNNKRTVMTIYFPQIERTPPSKGLAFTNFIRQKIINIFRSSLPSNAASLLLGIVFGIRENFDNQLLNNLRISGTLHVIAASGMNVSMVGSFFSSFLLLFFRRQVALILSILLILFYALLAGLEESIVRASIMGTLAFSALVLGRQNLAILGLFVAGYIMLFINPRALFDIGFQLSFAATLGLITLKPELDKLRVVRVVRGYQIGNDLTTTISAQIFTLPIILANFGTYSPLSILANTLILWTIAPLMVIGGIGSILALILPFLAKFALLLALPLIIVFEKIVEIFASFGELTVDNLSILIYIGYYLILFSAVILLTRKNV